MHFVGLIALLGWADAPVELVGCAETYTLPAEQDAVHETIVMVQVSGRSTPGLLVAEGGWILTTARGLSADATLVVRRRDQVIGAEVVSVDAGRGYALLQAEGLEGPCVAVSHSLPPAGEPLYDLGGLGGPVLDAEGLLVGFRTPDPRAEALTGRSNLLPVSFVSEGLGIRWEFVPPGPPSIPLGSVRSVGVESVPFAGREDGAVRLDAMGSKAFAPFRIARREVDQTLWLTHMEKNPSTSQSELKPVETVSFAMALRFCNALSREEGLTPAYALSGDQVVWDPAADGYRLPTSDEWELAARAGEATSYPGSDEPDSVAWYWGSGVNSSRNVGTKKPNDWGIYDASGNVAEWVWSGPYVQSLTSGTAIVRGGSWRSSRIDLRLDRSGKRDKSIRKDTIGFRVARSVQ